MRRTAILAVGVMLAVTACASGNGGGEPSDGDPPASSGNGGSGASGEVVNPQPPGQAAASVDGLDFSFDVLGPVVCNVSDSGFGWSFIQGDNEVTLAGGGSHSEGAGWGGRIALTIIDPEPDPDSGEQVIDTYEVFLPQIDPSDLAFDGTSMSYSGPVLKQIPGSSSPEDVGTGTFSATCP